MESQITSTESDVTPLDLAHTPPPLPGKKITPLVYFFGMLVIIFCVAFFLVIKSLDSSSDDRRVPPVQQACTLEAKVCPDGSSVGRTGLNCEFAECPTTETVTPSTNTGSSGKEVVDERPIGSLPYSYVSAVNTGSEWVESGIPEKTALRNFKSVDECFSLGIVDAGPLNKPLELYLSETYNLPTPINPEALHNPQYSIPGYKSITIGPMGVGEASHTAIQVNGRIITADVWARDLSVPHCNNPDKDQAKDIIESIRF